MEQQVDIIWDVPRALRTHVHLMFLLGHEYNSDACTVFSQVAVQSISKSSRLFFKGLAGCF